MTQPLEYRVRPISNLSRLKVVAKELLVDRFYICFSILVMREEVGLGLCSGEVISEAYRMENQSREYAVFAPLILNRKAAKRTFG
jgi:hypothetical protein